jgi:mannose-1-phosphate guanylyltransferase
MAHTMPFARAARTARATRQLTAVSRPSPAPWALILASGDGVRLRPLTQQITGDETPKQFCALLSDDTLWAETFRVPRGPLYGLLRVARRASHAPVVVLPSDHWVSDEATFMAHVDAAVAVVAERPELS